MYKGVVIEFTYVNFQMNGYIILPSFEDAERFMKEQLYVTHKNVSDYVIYCEPKVCVWHYENRKIAGWDKEVQIQVYTILNNL